MKTLCKDNIPIIFQEFHPSHLICWFLVLHIIGCTPMIYPPGAKTGMGHINDKQFITKDGSILPLKQWQPDQETTRAIVIALHGFNDYSNFFQQPGDYLRQQNIASYAYDQRGFGAGPNRGLWPGVEAYIEDLELFIQLIQQQNPDVPVYLLGESMGAAVVIITIARCPMLQVDGIILSAPAVWGRATMPWYVQTLLWTLSHTVPWLTLTGEGVEITPSDNNEMLKALSRDPLVIKKTRVETIYGLTNLMDAALSNAENIHSNTLVLYGEKDDIIPKIPTFEFVRNLVNKSSNNHTIAFYKEGYHMLLRDLQAPVLWDDISAWIASTHQPLPSGADKRAIKLLARHNSGE